MGCFMDDRTALGIHVEQWKNAAQGEGNDGRRWNKGWNVS